MVSQRGIDHIWLVETVNSTRSVRYLPVCMLWLCRRAGALRGEPRHSPRGNTWPKPRAQQRRKPRKSMRRQPGGLGAATMLACSRGTLIRALAAQRMCKERKRLRTPRFDGPKRTLKATERSMMRRVVRSAAWMGSVWMGRRGKAYIERER